MIDWSYVKQLETDVGAEEFRNIVALFLDEVDSEIELLRNSITGAGMLESKMHFLKGSAAYLGFREFAGLCAQNEVLAAGGRAEEVDLSQLISVYDQSRSFFLVEAPKHCSFGAAA